MEKKKVLSYGNLPTRLPIFQTAVVYLFLDFYDAPGVWWGVWGVIIALAWIFSFVNLFMTTSVDIFKNDK
jgi:hypothetical protein